MTLATLGLLAGAAALSAAAAVPLVRRLALRGGSIDVSGARFQELALGSPRSHGAGLRRVFQADGKHIHHRLLDLGLGQRRAVWVLYAAQAIACAIAVYRFVKQ